MHPPTIAPPNLCSSWKYTLHLLGDLPLVSTAIVVNRLLFDFVRGVLE